MKSSLIRFSVSALAFALAFGCGPKSTPKAAETATQAGGAVTDIPTNDRGHSEKVAQHGSLRCPYEEECSPSVGMLLAKDESVGICTGFLVAPDLAVTNSHCIPLELRKAGASCGGRISLLFSEMEMYAAERAECAQVLSASELDPSGQKSSVDYAVLRLSRSVSRPPLRVSGDGFPDSASMSVYRVNPVSGSTAQGELRKITCKVMQNSLLLPIFDQDQAPLVSLADCDMVSSNSGAPLIAEDGSVRGVLQSLIKRESTDLTERAFEDRAAFSLGTSFSCVNIPDAEAVSLPEVCRTDYSETNLGKVRAKMIEHGTPSALNAVRVHLDSWYAQASANALRLQWSPALLQSAPENARHREYVLVTAEPGCFQSPDLWMAKYKFLWFYNGRAAFQVSVPVWRVIFGTDRYRKISTKVVLEGTREMVVYFSPSELNKKGSSKTKMSPKKGSDEDAAFFDGALSVCPK